MAIFFHLLRKQLREQFWVLVLCSLMIGIFFTLYTYLYAGFGDTAMVTMARVSPQLLVALFGGVSQLGDPLTIWLGLLFVHPVVLTVFTAVVLSASSRALAGEIDRGTGDLLLSLPIARRQLVFAVLIVLQLVVLALVTLAWWSMRLGLVLGDIPSPASLTGFLWVAVNLWALLSCVAGIATLISAAVSERGRVLLWTVSFLVVSFFVNLIATLWSPAAWSDHFSVFHYYRPHPVALSGVAPVTDLAFLLGVAILSSLAAVEVFARRDVPAV